jgi:transposase
MYDVSKETNLGFLREAVKYLQEKLLFSEREIFELKRQKVLDEELCNKLSDELLVLKRKFFVGGKDRKNNSEKTKKRKKNTYLPHNVSPLNEEVKDRGNCKLEVEEVLYDLKDEFCCCENRAKILEMKNCFEESCEIHVTERKYILRRNKRKKGKCEKCGKIFVAEGGPKLTTGGEYSIHMGVQVVDDKFSHHLPLERQRKMMEEAGLNVDTKTLFSLTSHVASLLSDIPEMIRQEVLTQKWVHIDESPMKILKTDSNGYVWSISNNFGVYYQYEITRSGKVAKEMLGGFKGTVVCDAYVGYDFLEEIAGIILAYCWAHVRRRFSEAIENYPKAEEMVDLIDELYDIERKAQSFDELLTLRQKESTKVIEKIEAWLSDLKGGYLKDSTIGKAINYMAPRMLQLKRFLNDPYIPIDNNAGERAQRDPVMGRKNFLGFRTINGADVGMTHYSIIRTCKILRLNPKTYLLEMSLRAAKGELLKTPYQYGLEIKNRILNSEDFQQKFPS